LRKGVETCNGRAVRRENETDGDPFVDILPCLPLQVIVERCDPAGKTRAVVRGSKRLDSELVLRLPRGQMAIP